MEVKNEFKRKVCIYLSSIAVIISFIALCMAAYRTPDLNFDYHGILPSVWSILITVLIGWNIYSIIDIKNIRERDEKFKNDIKSEIKSLQDNLKKENEEFKKSIEDKIEQHDIDKKIEYLRHDLRRILADPDFSYKEGCFKGLDCKWDWDRDWYRKTGIWAIKDLVPLCPYHKTPLIISSDNINYKCSTCDFKDKKYSETEYNEIIEEILINAYNRNTNSK